MVTDRSHARQNHALKVEQVEEDSEGTSQDTRKRVERLRSCSLRAED